MGRLCSMHGRYEKCTQKFGPKAEVIGGKAWTGFVCCRSQTSGM